MQVNGVGLHYLDWGGAGEPVVFLAGLGNSAWIWSDFAPRFVDKYRVLAMTRRAHPPSETPSSGWDTATLTADVVAFLDAIQIDRAIFIGHSMAGDELTRLAETHPDRVAKLVYLDAAYDRGNLIGVMEAMPADTTAPAPNINSLDDLRDYLKNRLYGFWSAALEKEMLIDQEWEVNQEAIAAMLDESTRANPNYELVRAPALAIYSMIDFFATIRDNAPESYRGALRAWVDELYRPYSLAEVESFSSGVVNGETVLLENTHHMLFIQRADEVYGLVREFIDR